MADYGIQNATHSFNLPSPYQADLNKIAQQQKMAELLQAQSLQPSERYSYKGIEAQTPVTAGLAKMLQGFTAMQMQEKGLEEQKALGERYRQEGMDDITRYAEMAGKPAVAAVQGQNAFTPGVLDYEDQGGAQNLNVNEQGMVPAIAPAAARVRGQIDPSMIGQFKTPEIQRMALAQMLKQGELPAAFNLGADETRFQPPVGGGMPSIVARGAPKPLPSSFAPINPKDYTTESLKQAIKPDGTIDRTLLVAVTAAPTGNIAELALENADRKQKGLPPLSIGQYRERIAKAGKPDAAVTYGSPVAATDEAGNRVFFQPGKTGNPPSVIKGFTPPPTSEITKDLTSINQQKSTIQGAINAVQGAPTAFGLQRGAATTAGPLAESIAGRFDTKEEAEARAYVYNNVSAVIKERAGTAQSAQELTRINSFMPGDRDNADQIINKLTGYLKYLEDMKAGTIGNPTQAKVPEPLPQAPIYASSPGKPRMVSTDGGKTFKEAK